MQSVKWRRLAAVVVASVLCGCLGRTVEQHVVYQTACARRFATLVRLGQTTRQEEQDYSVASEQAWQALSEAMGLEIPGRQSKESSNGSKNRKQKRITRDKSAR